MTVRNSYQESNILKMHFASLRLCAKLGSQRRRDAKSIKDKGCEKYSTTNLFCQRVLVTDSHKKKIKKNTLSVKYLSRSFVYINRRLLKINLKTKYIP